MKTSFRKVLYRYISKFRYNKLENTIFIMVNASILFLLYIGIEAETLPSRIIPYIYRDKLLMFYVVTTLLLIFLRIIWPWYHRLRYAGIVEVVSNYVDVIIIAVLFGWVTGANKTSMSIAVSIVLLFDAVIFTVGAMYKKIAQYMIYVTVIAGLVNIFLYFITDKEVFVNLLGIPAGCILSFKVIQYWLILDTPYRRNLIIEFGPKDIDKSVIFVSKKKERNK